jgi:hypothetical protein
VGRVTVLVPNSATCDFPVIVAEELVCYKAVLKVLPAKSSNSSIFFLEYSRSPGRGPNSRLNQLLFELHCKN